MPALRAHLDPQVSNMPAACQKHVLDPNCVRMKILLHDCTGGVPADRQVPPRRSCLTTSETLHKGFVVLLHFIHKSNFM